jgi:hypothetical protein
MTNEQELRAKALELSVSILGGSADAALDKYLPLAGEIEAYIKGPPGKSTAGTAKTTGI